MLLASLIFVTTIALFIWQPKGLGIGWSGMGGAVVARLAGVVTLSDVPVVWGVVIAMLQALGGKDKATRAFVMAARFIADTASLPRVVSHLVNIVSADFYHVGFGD